MKRRLAREIAVQCLYQMEMNGVSPAVAIETAVHEALNDNEAGLDVRDGDLSTEYVEKLVVGVERHKSLIDRTLAEHLQGWRMDRLSRVDREVLRLAAYEMLFCEDIPAKVAVNEAIELAKHFGSEQSGKFVNGVLGKMLRDLPAIKKKIAEKNRTIF